jgi:hypothetical protein
VTNTDYLTVAAPFIWLGLRVIGPVIKFVREEMAEKRAMKRREKEIRDMVKLPDEVLHPRTQYDVPECLARAQRFDVQPIWFAHRSRVDAAEVLVTPTNRAGPHMSLRDPKLWTSEMVCALAKTLTECGVPSVRVHVDYDIPPNCYCEGCEGRGGSNTPRMIANSVLAPRWVGDLLVFWAESDGLREIPLGEFLARTIERREIA